MYLNFFKQNPGIKNKRFAMEFQVRTCESIAWADIGATRYRALHTASAFLNVKLNIMTTMPSLQRPARALAQNQTRLKVGRVPDYKTHQP